MIISPQAGLHENVMALDYDSEYANLIVNHNLSYETVTNTWCGNRFIDVTFAHKVLYFFRTKVQLSKTDLIFK